MRVAIYNQMFGLDGRSLLSNLLGHWAIHFQSNIKRIHDRVNFDRTINIIKKSNADIIGICEVLEGQHEYFKELLNKIGYRWVFFGRGHKLSHYNNHVIEIIASKIPCKEVKLGKWPVENRLGGGGGCSAIYIPQLKTHVFNAHLALPNRKYFQHQLEFISEKVKKIDEKIILLGDFNAPYTKIKRHFSGLRLISGEKKTCSITPLMKNFFWIDCDHIFAKGWEQKKVGELKGFSDHKLIYADVY